MNLSVAANTKEEKIKRALFVQLAALPQCIFTHRYGSNSSTNAVINMHSGQAVLMYRSTATLFSSDVLHVALCVPPTMVGGAAPNESYTTLNEEQLQKTLRVWTAQAKMLGLFDTITKNISEETAD